MVTDISFPPRTVSYETGSKRVPGGLIPPSYSSSSQLKRQKEPRPSWQGAKLGESPTSGGARGRAQIQHPGTSAVPLSPVLHSRQPFSRDQTASLGVEPQRLGEPMSVPRS